MKHLNKIISLLSIFMFMTGCGTQTESVSETVSESTAETSPEPVPVFESVSGMLHVTSDVDGFQFDLDSQESYFERYNEYTGEVSYSFQIDQVDAEIHTFGNYSMLTVSFSGEKLSDYLGDEAERKIALVLTVKDSSGIALESWTAITEDGLKAGEHFEKTESLISIEPGEYILDIHAQPDTYTIPVTENQEFLNPEKWYTTGIIENHLEKDSEFPFDSSADWITDYAMHEIYVDDELRLHGIFTEPYDLHEAEYAEKAESSGTQISDSQYGDTEYYDIDNPERFSEAIPEEAIPDSIRISLSPERDMLFGERPGLYVFFGYKHNPDDEYNYIGLGFESHPGKALDQEEWDNIIERAEEKGVDLSELAER